MSHATAGLHNTIPALPVHEVRAGVDRCRERFGFEAPDVTDDFAVLVRDEACCTSGRHRRCMGARARTWRGGARQRTSAARVHDARLDGNLLTFFRCSPDARRARSRGRFGALRER
jgi:hypothetical protein